MIIRWPLKTYEKVMKRYSSREIGKLAHMKTLKYVDDSNQQSKNEGLKMRDLLDNEKSFEMFMQHCGAEHCTESVLSLIEIIQFKQEVYKVLSSQGKSHQVINDIELEEDTFTLPSKCPKSDIVFDKNLNFKGIAHGIYVKYIVVGSDWEINLSYHTRRRMTRLFDNEERWKNNKEYDDNCKIYDVFEPCIREMTSIIRAAFSRFKQTDQFMILQNKEKSIKKVSSSYNDEKFLIKEQDTMNDSDDDNKSSNGGTDNGNTELTDIHSTTPMNPKKSGSAGSQGSVASNL